MKLELCSTTIVLAQKLPEDPQVHRCPSGSLRSHGGSTVVTVTNDWMIWVYHDLEHLHIDLHYPSDWYQARHMPGSIGFQSWIVILDNNSQLAPSQVQLGQVWAQVHPGQIPFCQKKGIQNNSGDPWCANYNFSSTSSTYQLHNTLHEVFLGNFGLQECPKLAVASNWLKIILKGKLDISWQETWLLKYTKPQKDSEKVQSTIISGIGFYQNRPLWWFWSSPSIFTFQRQTAANSCQIMAGSTARRSVALPFCPNCCPRRDNKETKGKGSIDSNKVMGEWNTLFWRM